MSKTITLPNQFEIEKENGSPAKYIKNHWTGSVALHDPMTLPQAEAFEQSRLFPDGFLEGGTRITFTAIDKWRFTALRECVQTWDIPGFILTVTKPESLTDIAMSPRRESHYLLEWIWNEIEKIYNGEQEIPNE